MNYQLYPMDTFFINTVNQTVPYSPKLQVGILKDLAFQYGYLTLTSCDITQDKIRIEQYTSCLSKENMNLAAVYLLLIVHEDHSTNMAYIHSIIEHLPQGTDIELGIHIKLENCEISSSKYDDIIVSYINDLDKTAQRGMKRIALYPHFDYWLETHEDALRLLKKTDNEHIGINFNAFHWYCVTNGQQNIYELLDMIAPKLLGVTLSGASPGGHLKGYNILPLNQGKLDNFLIIAALEHHNYKGRVGFQGYDLCGDAYDQIRTAKRTFLDILNRLERHPEWF